MKQWIEDKDGDTVELTDIICELLDYMNDKMNPEERNTFQDQIMPLISQSVVSVLSRMIGIEATAFHLAVDTTREAFIYSMCISFLLLKYVQKHDLKIFTEEEDISSEEIKEIHRKGEANKVAMMGVLMGADPRSILEKLKEEGKITDQDLRDMMGDLSDDDDESSL